ncbi:MAG: hypothetical protein KF774_09195 [Planctomyces sp.]|nr:hypothetical protein [Planctomyces sp.]
MPTSPFSPRRLFPLVVLWLLTGPALAQDVPAPLAKLELEDGDTLVFLGDSITHQGLYTQYVESYFLTRFPAKTIRFHNAGVGGARCWDALQRFDRDVAAYNPKYVTVLLGMNDGGYTPFNDSIFQTYRKDMLEVLERIEATGATPILMTPSMFDARAARLGRSWLNEEGKTYYNSVLAYYGAWLRDVATEKGYGFVDMWSPMNAITFEQRKSDPKFTMIQDAVHPGPAGQVVMAAAILNDLDVPRGLSSIRIRRDRQGRIHGDRSQGGALADLTHADDAVSFTWTAESLPWAVPEEAALGAELTNLANRWNAETLEVQGLGAGTYALTIDGEEVGRYPARALARGIRLQGNTKTPQYRQALDVATINHHKSRGPVQHLRDAWGQFQTYGRVRQASEGNPNDENLKEQLANLEKAVADLDARVEQFNAAIQEVDRELQEKRQPRPRRYALSKVDGAAPAEDENSAE